MRILILHNFYQHLGGEDTVVHQEAKALEKLGHEVKILTKKNVKGLKGLIQFGLYPFNLLILKGILDAVQDFQPDIVHIHNLHYAIGPVIIRAIKKKNIPVVMTLHNFRLICPSATLFYDNQIHTESIKQDFPWTAIKNKALDHSFLKTFITGFTYYIHKKIKTWNYVNQFIIMSAFNKDCFIKANIGLSNKNIALKPNFVDTNSKTDYTQRENHFLYVGRISNEKGIEQLVDHFSTLDETIRIIGEGPLLKELKKKTKHYTNIEWLGPKIKEEVMIELQRCNALIVPSVCYEGAFPLTAIEAMATKTPIIASSIGTIPDMIKEEKSGWLFNPHSKESLQKAIYSFKNAASVTEITDAAYNLYLSTFQKDIIINRLTSIYQDAIFQNEHNNNRPT